MLDGICISYIPSAMRETNILLKKFKAISREISQSVCAEGCLALIVVFVGHYFHNLEVVIANFSSNRRNFS